MTKCLSSKRSHYPALRCRWLNQTLTNSVKGEKYWMPKGHQMEPSVSWFQCGVCLSAIYAPSVENQNQNLNPVHSSSLSGMWNLLNTADCQSRLVIPAPHGLSVFVWFTWENAPGALSDKCGSSSTCTSPPKLVVCQWLYWSPVCRDLIFSCCFLSLNKTTTCIKVTPATAALLWMLIRSMETATASLNPEALHYLL